MRRNLLSFLLTSLLVGLASLATQAQEPGGVLRGKVMDRVLKSPLPGANLQWMCPAKDFTTPPTTAGTASLLDGTYELRVLPGCSLRVSAIGYQTRWIWVPSATAKEAIKALDIVLEPVTMDLDAVVISAGRFEQRLSEVSVSMQILKPELLQQNNLTRLDDAMDRVPGVSIVNGQANIRGTSGFSYGAGSRVQVLLDEMPLLSADANDVRWAFMPMEILSQIEVIKGASSVLFGSGSWVVPSI